MLDDLQCVGNAQSLNAHSFLRNGILNVAGQTLRGTIGLITIPFLIRFLGIKEYGIWTLAYAVLALMTMSEAGISIAATVFLSRDLAGNDRNATNSTLTIIAIGAAMLSCGLGLVLWFAGPLIVRALPAFGAVERMSAGRALQIAGCGVSILILQRTLVGIEQSFNQYMAINVLDFGQSLLSNVGMVVVAWLGGRTVAMMKWQILASAVFLAGHSLVVYLILRGKGLNFSWSGDKARRIFRYSAATWVSTLGSAAFGQCDRLIVGGILGPSVLGVYSAITGITSKINSFSGTAVQPLVPSLSRGVSNNPAAEARIRQAAHLNALIAIEAGIFLYVMADWVMRVMVPGVTAPLDVMGLQVAAIIYALYSISAPGYYVLFSLGEARTNAIIVLSSAIVSLGLIFVGGRYFGLLGALAGNAGYTGTLLMNAFGLRKAGVSLRRYITWIAPLLIGLAGALFTGWALDGHLRWRAVFIILQGVFLLFWYCRTQTRSDWMRFAFGSVS